MNPWSTPEPFLNAYFVSSRGPLYEPGESQSNAGPALKKQELELHVEGSSQKADSLAEGSGQKPSLITSPEFNLKILWSQLGKDLYEIAHCFRAGEHGTIHSSEFLMLEWYWSEDEFRTIQFIQEMIEALVRLPGLQNHAPETSLEMETLTIEELFRSRLDCSLQKKDLIAACQDRGHFHHDSQKRLDHRNYEEFFFTLFLNYLEPGLDPSRLIALYGYPAELAAYATVQNGRARRFEIYWKGLELANGYFELTDPAEQKERMLQEADLKKRITGQYPVLPHQFLQQMETGLPEGTGVALGLERLLMALTGNTSIQQISPFPSTPDDPE